MRAAIAALAILALAIVPAHADDDDDDEGGGPSVASLAAANVGPNTATLTARVDPDKKATSYRFDYGPTPAYGQSVTGTVPGSSGTVTVSAPLQNLSPKTIYYIRVHVSDGRRSDTAWALPFTTKPAAVTPTGASSTPGRPAASADGAGAPAAPGAAQEPELGETMVVAPAAGTVRVRQPGTGAFVALGAGDAVPVGSVVDTRDGAVRLTSALAGGGTQTATFGAGVFEVRQSPERDGLTDIILRGGDFTTCGAKARGRAAAAPAAARRPPRRNLWAEDNGGRFRTRGRNSVATVRGTRWTTTDTCAGTRTTVTEGAVSVRDLRAKRTVLVRAGRSYLARARR